MNARDELAQVINSADDAWDKVVAPSVEWAQDMADAVLAAGYSKPRAITTAEELDALPEGTRIVDKAELLTLEETSMECLEWVDRHGNACHVELPATVLYIPEAAA